MTPRLFSVGHSTHELAEFVGRLRAYEVEQVADVRRHPRSRRLPWFNEDALRGELPQQELLYAHLPELGGRRRPSRDSPHRGWRVEGFRGYADHMAGREFAAALEVLEELARERATAMMCAEGLWWRCHRRLLADAAVLVRGAEVLHLDHRGRLEPHRPTDGVRRDGDLLAYDLGSTPPLPEGSEG